MSLEENSNTYKLYTKEKVQYLEKMRKTEDVNVIKILIKLLLTLFFKFQFYNDFDDDELTDIRRTVAITPKGACEV